MKGKGSFDPESAVHKNIKTEENINGQPTVLREPTSVMAKGKVLRKVRLLYPKISQAHLSSTEYATQQYPYGDAITYKARWWRVWAVLGPQVKPRELEGCIVDGQVFGASQVRMLLEQNRELSSRVREIESGQSSTSKVDCQNCTSKEQETPAEKHTIAETKGEFERIHSRISNIHETLCSSAKSRNSDEALLKARKEQNIELLEKNVQLVSELADMQLKLEESDRVSAGEIQSLMDALDRCKQDVVFYQDRATRLLGASEAAVQKIRDSLGDVDKAIFEGLSSHHEIVRNDHGVLSSKIRASEEAKEAAIRDTESWKSRSLEVEKSIASKEDENSGLRRAMCARETAANERELDLDLQVRNRDAQIEQNEERIRGLVWTIQNLTKEIEDLTTRDLPDRIKLIIQQKDKELAELRQASEEAEEHVTEIETTLTDLKYQASLDASSEAAYEARVEKLHGSVLAIQEDRRKLMAEIAEIRKGSGSSISSSPRELKPVAEEEEADGAYRTTINREIASNSPQSTSLDVGCVPNDGQSCPCSIVAAPPMPQNTAPNTPQRPLTLVDTDSGFFSGASKDSDAGHGKINEDSPLIRKVGKQHGYV